MFEEKGKITVSGVNFDYDVFLFLFTRFKEAFSHASLSIEKAFDELDIYDIELEKRKNEAAYSYFQLLSDEEKKNIISIVKQIIVFKGKRFGMFSEEYDGSNEQTAMLYEKYFHIFSSYVLHYLAFNSKGKFDKVATFNEIDKIFHLVPQRMLAYDKAYNMQKDNLDAFDYAMTLKDIGIPETIQINTLVNKSDVDRVEGFKKTNNAIIGASFTPVDKRNVSIEMMKLFYDYNNNFGIEIEDPFEFGISSDEKNKRLNKIYSKEAIFHIRFERIHPFNDGNGRTGRIILNQHLLKQNIAPVLITGTVSNEYKKMINENDVDGLAFIFSLSSSQQSVEWATANKVGSEIHVDNSKLAELEGYDTNETSNSDKQLKKYN